MQTKIDPSPNQQPGRAADTIAHPPGARSTRKPLRGPVFHVLLALGNDSLHGYAIMQRFAEETGEALLPGTLYSSMAHMLAEGLVAEVPSPDPGDDPRRRYYRITDRGREAARQEAERMQQLVELARRQRLVTERSR